MNSHIFQFYEQHPGIHRPRDSPLTPQETVTIQKKKKRGRQPRPNFMTPSLRSAVADFTDEVGAPVLQPQGFRDFSSWLGSISQPRFRTAWVRLVETFMRESAPMAVQTCALLKRDLVHEIMHIVVKRKDHESAKLVSTNARRQSRVPQSGYTVMSIFESYLASLTRVDSAVATSHKDVVSVKAFEIPNIAVLKAEEVPRHGYETNSTNGIGLRQLSSLKSSSSWEESLTPGTSLGTRSQMDISTLLVRDDFDAYGTREKRSTALPSFAHFARLVSDRRELESCIVSR